MCGTSAAALPIQGCPFSCIHLGYDQSCQAQPNPISISSYALTTFPGLQKTLLGVTVVSHVSAMTHSYGDTKLYPFPANPCVGKTVFPHAHESQNFDVYNAK